MESIEKLGARFEAVWWHILFCSLLVLGQWWLWLFGFGVGMGIMPLMLWGSRSGQLWQGGFNEIFSYVR
jgi:hypothetical protein